MPHAKVLQQHSCFSDKWHLDEMQGLSNGEVVWQRGVDQDGRVLDLVGIERKLTIK